MRVVIAEDSVVLRDGMVHLLLRRGHEVPAAVGDADSLLTAVAEHEPDAAIVDVRMPPTHTDDGLRAALELRRRHRGLGVLVFSQYVETRAAAQLLADNRGGVGYLLKDRVADVGDFLNALTRVAAGGTALDPEVVSQIVRTSRQVDGLAALTPREREVLGLMAEGRSNSAVAASMHLSYGSVEKHVTAIFTKLGLAASDTDHRRVLAVLRYLSAGG